MDTITTGQFRRGLHHQQNKVNNMQQPTHSTRGYEKPNDSYISSPTYTQLQ